MNLRNSGFTPWIFGLFGFYFDLSVGAVWHPWFFGTNGANRIRGGGTFAAGRMVLRLFLVIRQGVVLTSALPTLSRI